MTDEHGEVPLAAYLAGELDDGQANAVDLHVMTCEQCWTEVQLARAGELAAASSVEAVPDELRRRVAAAFAGADRRAPRRRRAKGRALALAAAVILLLAGFGAGLLVRGGNSSGRSTASACPSPLDVDRNALAGAVACYRAGMLPGSAVTARPMPDLGPLGLHLTACASGYPVGASAVTYAYADSRGHRVFVFLSTRPFVDTQLPRSGTTTLRIDRDLTAYVTTTHPMLVIGGDDALVAQVGRRLT